MELARERAMTVLSATGVQCEARLAFSGLHQMLRPVRARAAALPSAHRAALDAAFGLGDGPPPEHFRIAMAVLDLLSEVAAEAPLVLVAEDAHWLDRATSDVLAFVARRLESDPIVLLAASCDGYRTALDVAGLAELRLAALEPDAAAELLTVSARNLSVSMRRRLLREAAGNPLALFELPEAAARLEHGAPLPDTLPLTERLEHAFAARVSDLPEETRLLLLVAALNDGESVNEVLLAAGAVAGDTLRLELLEPADQASIIDLDVRTLRFRHPCSTSRTARSARTSTGSFRSSASPRAATWVPLSPRLQPRRDRNGRVARGDGSPVLALRQPRQQAFRDVRGAACAGDLLGRTLVDA